MDALLTYDFLHEMEKKLIAQALAATNGNVTAAAKKLGISRRTLHRKINEMNLAKAPAETTRASGEQEVITYSGRGLSKSKSRHAEVSVATNCESA